MGSTLSKNEWRPFDPDSESPYDMNHYIGRIAHFYTILDPRTLLLSHKQLQSSKEVLSRFQANPSIVNDPATNRLLWRSKLNLSAVMHPDTKDPIFWAFRFSAFPVINIPVWTLICSSSDVDVDDVDTAIGNAVEDAIGGLIEEALLVRRPLTCDDMLHD